MSASERMHELGRAWAKKIHRPPGSRDAWARFETDEQKHDDEHEQRGGNA